MIVIGDAETSGVFTHPDVLVFDDAASDPDGDVITWTFDELTAVGSIFEINSVAAQGGTINTTDTLSITDVTANTAGHQAGIDAKYAAAGMSTKDLVDASGTATTISLMISDLVNSSKIDVLVVSVSGTSDTVDGVSMSVEASTDAASHAANGWALGSPGYNTDVLNGEDLNSVWYEDPEDPRGIGITSTMPAETVGDLTDPTVPANQGLDLMWIPWYQNGFTIPSGQMMHVSTNPIAIGAVAENVDVLMYRIRASAVDHSGPGPVFHGQWQYTKDCPDAAWNGITSTMIPSEGNQSPYNDGSVNHDVGIVDELIVSPPPSVAAAFDTAFWDLQLDFIDMLKDSTDSRIGGLVFANTTIDMVDRPDFASNGLLKEYGTAVNPFVDATPTPGADEWGTVTASIVPTRMIAAHLDLSVGLPNVSSAASNTSLDVTTGLATMAYGSWICPQTVSGAQTTANGANAWYRATAAISSTAPIDDVPIARTRFGNLNYNYMELAPEAGDRMFTPTSTPISYELWWRGVDPSRFDGSDPRVDLVGFAFDVVDMNTSPAGDTGGTVSLDTLHIEQFPAGIF
ncbi:hypothetical protein ACFL34_02375 [Candidatus Sumerlaeota bacterium]